MNNRMLALIKTQLNMNFGISALKYRYTKEKKKRWEPILIGASILFGFGSLIVLYTLFMLGIFTASIRVNPPHPEIMLTMAFLAAQVIILFFGIFYIIGNFYFSNDLNTLVALPLKPYEVLGSKFIVVMVNEYLTALPILLPPLIIFGIGTGQGILFWIKGIILILAAPVIPLIIGAVFVMLMMRVVNLRRNKDLFAIIGGFLVVVLALGLNIFIQNSVGQQKSADFFNQLVTSKYGLIEEIGRRFPPALWASLGLADNGLLGFANFIMFVAVSALLFIILLWLSNQVFYKALLAGQEVSRKRKAMTSSELAKQYDKASNPVTAIFKREWKLLLRTPIYVINGLTGAIIGPFILLIMFFAKGSDKDTMQIFSFISNPEYSLYVTLGGLGVILFTAGMNVVASTAVSREGNTFWIAKMIPVTPKQQITAKFIHGYLISVIGVVSTCIVLGIFLKFSFLRILVIFILGLLGSVSMASSNLLLDVFNPKLTWNSEQEAMKQNMNSMLGMLVSLLLIVLFAAPAVILILSNAQTWLIYAGIGIIEIILAILSMLALYALANIKYKDYEV